MREIFIYQVVCWLGSVSHWVGLLSSVRFLLVFSCSQACTVMALLIPTNVGIGTLQKFGPLMFLCFSSTLTLTVSFVVMTKDFLNFSNQRFTCIHPSNVSQRSEYLFYNSSNIRFAPGHVLLLVSPEFLDYFYLIRTES
jgi:hypothetical protein